MTFLLHRFFYLKKKQLRARINPSFFHGIIVLQCTRMNMIDQISIETKRKKKKEKKEGDGWKNKCSFILTYYGPFPQVLEGGVIISLKGRSRTSRRYTSTTCF